MDVVAKLVTTADECGALQQIGRHRMAHRISLYADDVMLFIRPVAAEMETVQVILQAFGEATGLQVNFPKSSITLIQCNDFQHRSPCTIVWLPSREIPLQISGDVTL
jgi:hypothetical protein